MWGLGLWRKKSFFAFNPFLSHSFPPTTRCKWHHRILIHSTLYLHTNQHRDHLSQGTLLNSTPSQPQGHQPRETTRAAEQETPESQKTTDDPRVLGSTAQPLLHSLRQSRHNRCYPVSEARQLSLGWWLLSCFLLSPSFSSLCSLPSFLFPVSPKQLLSRGSDRCQEKTMMLSQRVLSLSLHSHCTVLCSLVSLLEEGTQHDLLETAPGSAENLEAQQSAFWSDRKQHYFDPCGNIASQVPLLDLTAV